jgi:hypothetical protein
MRAIVSMKAPRRMDSARTNRIIMITRPAQMKLGAKKIKPATANNIRLRLIAAQIPASRGLDFTLALTFIALVVPLIKDRPSLLAALTAGAVALLAAGLPYKLSLLTAALAGIIVGLWSEKR